VPDRRIDSLDPETPLLVFADDWGRHPSSCQHLVRRMLATHPVIWANTIGTRPPRLDANTLRRVAEKLRGWSSRTPADSRSPANPRVVELRMWPWVRSRFDRQLNRRLLARQLAPVLNALDQPPIVITTIPIIADLVGQIPAARWVYYAVDDFSTWPGLAGAALRRLDDQLIQAADVRIAASQALQERMQGLAQPVHLLTHGVDLDHWQTPPTGTLPSLDNLPRPLIVFWGLIDRRMDLSWLSRLAHDLDTGTILLVGPQDDPDPALAALPRVVMHPALPHRDLPLLARGADVLVMPYADLPVTRAMQPLKLTEYLASGLPVVTRDLPATRAWSDALDTATTAEQFSHLVRLRLESGLPPAQQQARRRLDQEDWNAKARQFTRWILEPSDERQDPTAPSSRSLITAHHDA
jgi:glycosyltransferase involved in cell wall biosynthesis